MLAVYMKFFVTKRFSNRYILVAVNKEWHLDRYGIGYIIVLGQYTRKCERLSTGGGVVVRVSGESVM